MKKLKQLPLLFLLLIILPFFFSGCKEKGCTDPSAINYNSVADENDGSCIYCNGQTETLDTSSCFLIDNNFSSPHYNEVVGVFYLKQIKTTYSFSECGSKSCGILVGFKSNVIEQMDFTVSLQGSGVLNISWSKTLTVQPNDSIDLGGIPKTNISNPCSPISGTSLFVQTFNPIIYN